ncbi:MAG TPA: twin-arginine translocase TatA/TatE family subunit [Anaeromyxobacter sp.]|nr:twin-arginine translocase TatA/TatE family subunit [Anaeromyxobacter sp.]
MSFTELAIIAVLALVLLGPDQLPEAARKAARGLRMLRQAADGLRAEVRALELRAGEDDGVAAGLSALRDLQSLAGQATSRLRSEVLALTREPDPAPRATAPAEPPPGPGPKPAAAAGVPDPAARRGPTA